MAEEKKEYVLLHDKTPILSVYGHPHGIRFEQDGHFFNKMGSELIRQDDPEVEAIKASLEAVKAFCEKANHGQAYVLVLKLSGMIEGIGERWVPVEGHPGGFPVGFGEPEKPKEEKPNEPDFGPGPSKPKVMVIGKITQEEFEARKAEEKRLSEMFKQRFGYVPGLGVQDNAV